MKYLKNILLIVFITLTSIGSANHQLTGYFANNFMNNNRYAVTDQGGQIWVCSYGDNSIRIWHPLGIQSEFSKISTGMDADGFSKSLTALSGIAVDTDGIIYVSSNALNEKNIYKYQSWDGVPLRGIKQAYSIGDLDIDNNNYLFITENKPKSCYAAFHILNQAGNEIPGSPIQLNELNNRKAMRGTNFRTPGIGVTKDGKTVYVAAESLNKVFIFQGSVSKQTAQFEFTGELKGNFNHPVACEVDPEGNIYVSCSGNNTIYIYDSTHNLIEKLAHPSMKNPYGVAFNANQKVLYVAMDVPRMFMQRWADTRVPQVSILGYHNVTASWKNVNHGMNICPDNLRDQLTFLKDHGYNVIRLRDFYQHWLKGTALPEKPIVLTFDDGLLGQVKYGLPILKEYNDPATIFVITGATGNNYLTWDKMKSSMSSGLIDYYSHTVSHPAGNKVSEDSSFFEYVQSKKDIENYLGIPCDFLAYPFGYDYFTSTTNNINGFIPSLASKAGYKMAFSYAGGYASQTTPRFNTPRVIMNGADTLNDFKKKIGYIGPRIDQDPYIIDNKEGGDGKFLTVGSWSTATYCSNTHYGCYGDNFRVSIQGAINNKAIFSPDIKKAGAFKVFVWWNKDYDRSTAATYIINDLFGKSTILADQKNNGFCWYFLGTCYFGKGRSGSISLSGDTNGSVDADAIKLEPVFSMKMEDFSGYTQYQEEQAKIKSAHLKRNYSKKRK